MAFAPHVKCLGHLGQQITNLLLPIVGKTCGFETEKSVQISPTQLAKCGSILSFLDVNQTVHWASGISVEFKSSKSPCRSVIRSTTGKCNSLAFINGFSNRQRFLLISNHRKELLNISTPTLV